MKRKKTKNNFASSVKEEFFILATKLNPDLNTPKFKVQFNKESIKIVRYKMYDKENFIENWK